MKCCPDCQRLYPDDAGFCPIDGKHLVDLEEAPTPIDSDDRRIGTTVCGGRYQVRRKVADGGMGRVYQAVDLLEKRSVALKVLHPEVATDRVSVERFKREYALSSELPHDHIVEVFDFQKTEDESYALVMEYLEGEELRELLKRDKTIPAARAIRILSQLAIGLQEPHQRKLVHRDIKPDNIFLCHTADGPVVKLLDFGSVRDNTEGAKKLTVMGTTIGSPFYMSPEQAQGLAELDHRADVWSIAAILYEALTGEVPFGGKAGPQILLAILGHDPQPISIAGASQGVPATLDDVIADGLAKEPSTRIASVDDLADRFGRAYGLEGTHRDWAYMPEVQLEALIEQRLPLALAAGRAGSAGVSPTLVDDAADPVPGGGLEDPEFIMGVPDKSPVGLYVGVGIGVLMILGAVVAFFLL
ncbi:MAG: serine/threonine-protein kinase [Polyangiaceae bacterium]